MEATPEHLSETETETLPAITATEAEHLPDGQPEHLGEPAGRYFTTPPAIPPLPASPPLADLYRVSHAARLSCVHRSTLLKAMSSGYVPTYRTACGLPLVSLADARRWAIESTPLPYRPELLAALVLVGYVHGDLPEAAI